MPDPGQSPAIVLLSGGLDSATVLAIAAHEGRALYALTFDYGQRQSVELDCAKRLAREAGTTEHRVVQLNPTVLTGSALTGDAPVPKDRPLDDAPSGIPVTYVPARNALFLTHALAWGEAADIFDIFIGANAIDYSGYPDCRPAFIDAFEKMANLGTKAADNPARRFRIHAPLMHMNKADIIQRGVALGVDYAMTHSCYDPIQTLACGHCDACALRRQGFENARIPDPTTYASQIATEGVA